MMNPGELASMSTMGRASGEPLSRTCAETSLVHPLEILVVDDDAGSRSPLVAALRQQGHSCREAGDADEALRALKKLHADVVLCDWEMPGTSGLELCRQTRAQNGYGPYTYFILMTGHDDPRRLLGAMKAGADDYERKPVDLDELEARLVLASRVVALHRCLREQAARLRRDSQRLYVASHTDALTGVDSRLALEETLEAVRSERERYGRRASLAVCDVDLFKQYNDRFGHVAGDDALRRVAQAIKAHLRASDRVYRYGGEEFVVLLPEQGLEEAALAIDRVRQEIERLHIETPAPSQWLTMSAGVAELGTEDATGSDWIKRADAALYRAKARGRNLVETDPSRSG
jgi:diguanylate cyclase (GGDEF)-like protein